MRNTFTGLLIATLMYVANHLDAQVQQGIPLPEHPDPQFKREKWFNLNGVWDFSIDEGESGNERGLSKDASGYEKKILVPFCPESKLSGIEHLDFMPVVWYHRSFEIPEEWEQSLVFLHFGGVDYHCEVWVNGQKVGSHFGGSTKFSFDISNALKKGRNDVFVRAEDNIRSYVQPAGKQSLNYYHSGCYYTRVTGIWQTVWLEARSRSFIKSVKIIPDIDQSSFLFIPDIENIEGTTLEIILFDRDGKKVANDKTFSNGQTAILYIKDPNVWSPENPYLYDVKYVLRKNGEITDRVDSYAALRKVHVAGNTVYLNNEPFFLRFALIQGFYPGGVWTPPDDRMLKEDIERAVRVGFNGARLHQKIFENRFLYWADQLGFLVWREFPDWGCRSTYKDIEGFNNLKREWIEAMVQQWNHPSIIAWTILNESGNINEEAFDKNPEDYTRAIKELYDITRLLDPTRPIIDASGYIQVKTDIITQHNNYPTVESFSKMYGSRTFQNYDSVFRVPDKYKNTGIITSYKGDKPFLVDEYGAGVWLPEWINEPRDPKEFGKGRSAEEMVSKIRGMTEVLTGNPYMAGFSYVQLYDVMQEINGVYTFEREPKYSMEELRKIFGAPAKYMELRKKK